MASTNGGSALLDPSLLAGLSEEQRQEALAAAAAAKRAEERAEQRALERAMKERQAQRQREREMEAPAAVTKGPSETKSTGLVGGTERVAFVSKKKRKEAAAANGDEAPEPKRAAPANGSKQPAAAQKSTASAHSSSSSKWNDSQWAAVKQSYLGKSVKETEMAQLEKRKKQRVKKKMTFRFAWDNTDDTSHLDHDDDPLYSSVVPSTSMFGKRRTKDLKAAEVSTVETARTKPLSNMTARDWRIFRENYNIVIRGGKAPPPLRSFRESPSPDLPLLHPTILDAVENTLKYKEPSPIQRQSIPIGLQRRDMIGIAETGSGKTAAFGIPLLNFLFNFKDEILDRVADQGPLALVMAPTRELALQIDVEFHKLLSRQDKIKSVAIVGGQPILEQAQKLRAGVHVIVGTPGRINDCLEMTYLVLNQCSYIVLDEADRMIDMGFKPQIESILDAMGGMLKSEDEQLTYEQEREELESLKKGELPRHRLTAMFSATMPPEVERLANDYLRHPAIIKIGDRDSGKNSRITQKIMFLASPSQKEKALKGLLQKAHHNDKIIVFVNEKKHADGIGRMVERSGKRSVVLHGGKSQDQREENLGAFRRGGVVLVATDVAGRGLDIPDVSLVINYDLPTRSIENYTHRIGRTGRAGKEGLAVSFMTDEDENIMPALKAYLESTGNHVPDRLARHPAANKGVNGGNIF